MTFKKEKYLLPCANFFVQQYVPVLSIQLFFLNFFHKLDSCQSSGYLTLLNWNAAFKSRYNFNYLTFLADGLYLLTWQLVKFIDIQNHAVVHIRLWNELITGTLYLLFTQPIFWIFSSFPWNYLNPAASFLIIEMNPGPTPRRKDDILNWRLDREDDHLVNFVIPAGSILPTIFWQIR